MMASNFKFKKPKKEIGVLDRAKDGIRMRDLIGPLIGLISLLSILLVQIGYGVATAVGDKFAIPHESLVGSSFDLLQLSFWAIVWFFNNLNKVPDFWSLYFTTLFPFFIYFAVFLLTWIGIVIYKKKQLKSTELNPQKISVLARLFSRLTFEESRKFLIFRGAVYSFLAFLGLPFIFIITLYFLLLTLILSATPTVLGNIAGIRHIDKYVIAPKDCRPLATLKFRLEVKDNLALKLDPKMPDYATCVSLTKDGKELGRGRVVFTTSSAIILFDPLTGSVVRYPSKDLILSLVPTLDITRSVSTEYPPDSEPEKISGPENANTSLEKR